MNSVLGDEFKIVISKKGAVSPIPTKDTQAGWTEAFNAVADAQNDELLIELANKFDEKEWIW